jgi:hypothetical protein
MVFWVACTQERRIYEKAFINMDKDVEYKSEVKSFSDYASEYPASDLFKIYTEWAAANDIYGLVREEIWRLAKSIRPAREHIIKEGDEEFVRLWAVLDMLFDHDFSLVSKMIEEKRENN